eukprot:8364917-Pyramimonas_sp.AAC.1
MDTETGVDGYRNRCRWIPKPMSMDTETGVVDTETGVWIPKPFLGYRNRCLDTESGVAGLIIFVYHEESLQELLVVIAAPRRNKHQIWTYIGIHFSSHSCALAR